jgi:hypothetical protein
MGPSQANDDTNRKLNRGISAAGEEIRTTEGTGGGVLFRFFGI